MATQPIDRQRFKHQLKQSRKPVGMTEIQKLKLAEHEAFIRERRWLHDTLKGGW